MLSIINKLIGLLFLTCLSIACNFVQEGNEQKTELTQEQEAALEALNTLQTSTDERNRFYSTFANQKHSFYPPDTSFEVSQSELLIYIEQFISEHCQNLAPEIQHQLAKKAVLAQKKYTVLYCTVTLPKSNINPEQGPPMKGIWVMPSVLDSRDVILVW